MPIVLVASSQEQGAAAKAASSPASALSIGNGTPITPVDETNTSDGLHASAPATLAAIASTAARPRPPVKALALPALTTTARASPRTSTERHHSTSGEGHLLCVSTPATVVPGSSVMKVRSLRSHGLYPARATRGVTPAIAGRAGKGRAERGAVHGGAVADRYRVSSGGAGCSPLPRRKGSARFRASRLGRCFDFAQHERTLSFSTN